MIRHADMIDVGFTKFGFFVVDGMVWEPVISTKKHPMFYVPQTPSCVVRHSVPRMENGETRFRWK